MHFAVQNGNIATATRDVPGWPVIVNLRAEQLRPVSPRLSGKSGAGILLIREMGKVIKSWKLADIETVL